MQNLLVESIKSNPRYSQATGAYVSVYRTWSCYGGPEEGGWWKTYYKLEGCVYFPSEEQAQEYLEEATSIANKIRLKELSASRDHLLRNWDDTDDSGDESLCRGWSDDCDDFRVVVESERGSLDNTQEPIGHYE